MIPVFLNYSISKGHTVFHTLRVDARSAVRYNQRYRDFVCFISEIIIRRDFYV